MESPQEETPRPEQAPAGEQGAGLSFTEHLLELRRRLIISVAAVLVGTVAAYAFKERIFEFLAWPLIKALPTKDHGLIFTSLVEPFFIYLKISLVAGIVLALPVILYQVWMFIGPGLYAHEKKIVFPLVLFSSFFFVLGAAFAYFGVFPFGFKALMDFAGPSMTPFPSVREYYDLVSLTLLVFGLIFELPLFITVFARFGLVTPAFLRKYRRYAILVIFIVAAILTPPDVFSQMLMAIPLCILYEVSILGAVMFGKERKKPAPPGADAAPPPGTPPPDEPAGPAPDSSGHAPEAPPEPPAG